MTNNVVDVSGSESVTAQAGTITDVTLTVTYTNYKEFTSSTAVRISGACTRLDVTAGGGGGCGSNSSRTVNSVQTGGSGAGGGGGYVTVKENVAFTPNTNLSVNIGAAGKGSAGAAETNATDGGTTSFLSVTASGGKAVPNTAAVGNGNGGAGIFYDLHNGNSGGAGTVNGYSVSAGTSKEIL